MSSAVEQGEANLSVATSEQLGAAQHDSPQQAELRAKAAKLAFEMEMPSPMERPWKYLDVRTLSLDAYRPGLGAEGAEAPTVDGDYAAIVRQVNGETVSVEVRAEGLQIIPFERNEDAKTHELIDTHLGSVVPFDRDKLTALHYAFERGGLLIYVAPNAEIKQPVRISRWFATGKQLGTPHTLVVTGANTEVSVVEDYQSSDDDIVIIPVVELVPGPSSRVHYSALHRWGTNTRVFSQQRTVTEHDSELVSVSLVSGGAVVKSHIESSLIGRGSSSDLLGLGVGRGREHADFYTLQDHIGPDTRSDLLFKSALKDSSRAIYYGVTRVGLGAKNADANQEDRNLLLSKDAKADSDPVLEILTNDVIRVSHGATAGPVDEEQLFYMESRGLPPADAEALLVSGFLSEVIDRIGDEQLREEVRASLDARMAD
ncbi:MAG: Fe-S cluster assembly protein SufD [Dehalococcoidia bacterium]|nr:Fe-S cluster assembly protein SufD [Dehalococcoidia bacterium]